jgi:opacity protein-like surface antigen
MKTFAIACAAVLLFAATASAADVAVSQSTLDKMGLSGMQQMSDDEGMEVRGQGLFEDWLGGAISQLVGTSIDFGGTIGGLGDVFQFNFGNSLGFDFGHFNF